MTAQNHAGTGRRVGYIRVSSLDQDASPQLDGIQVDKTFTEDTKRPQLQAAREYVHEGDTLVVHSMDRLARNLGDLCRIVRELTADGVAVEFVTERLKFTREETEPHSELLLQVLGAVAQFERTTIRERQQEGIEKAKAKGKYRGRRPSLTPEDIARLKAAIQGGIPKAAVARQFKISRQTLYSYLGDDGRRKQRCCQ
jgi:DNA invertase Pin-like site-specific DNA recombinase